MTNSTVDHKKWLAYIYRNTNNLLVTIAGVGETHVDIADFFATQGKLLGYIIYNPNPIIYQPVLIGYEHSLDTFLDITTSIPKNCIYIFPSRSHQLLTPAIPKFYQRQPGQAIFSHKQGMIYQPIQENYVNPNLLLQLLFAKQHYYRKKKLSIHGCSSLA